MERVKKFLIITTIAFLAIMSVYVLLGVSMLLMVAVLGMSFGYAVFISMALTMAIFIGIGLTWN